MQSEDLHIIRYGQQEITQADIDAVLDVLHSDNLTQGPAIPRFENLVIEATGATHAVSMTNASSALLAACLSLNLGKNDWLWTTPNTFVASANCAIHCGAKVDFVDIDPKTYNMCVEKLEEKLILASKRGKLPKILVPVHFAGQPCDMVEIHRLSKVYGFKIIEDASHAIGAKYDGFPVGCCKHSDVTVFSFHPVKIITTGEGGMALTRDPELATRLRHLRSHGITRDLSLMSPNVSGDWYYEQVSLGFNFRMTDIQAALGATQLARLVEYVERRHEIAKIYDMALENLPINLPWQDPRHKSSYHLYVIHIPQEKGLPTRRKIFDCFRKNGVMVNVHYIPVHLQPFYRKFGFEFGDYPCAEAYYAGALSIPIHPTLSSSDQEKVISLLKDMVV